jgi:hypothetical protein
MSNRPSQDVLALRRLDAEIGNKRMQVYRNLLNQPYVILDITERTDAANPPAIHLPLFHKDVRFALTWFIWEAEGLLLHQRELDRILEALAGLSLHNRVSQVIEPVLLELLESEPTVAVIVEYLRGERPKRIELAMESLWKLLRDFACERQLLVRGKNRFPGGANVLTRKLHRFETELR